MLSGASPSISVVVNNYNYGRYLAEALDSALGQLAQDDELVVVDDGSSDDSLAVLAGYAERPGVRVLAQSNQGQLRAVFNGLAAARGELVALLDSDDVFLPGYLERLRCRARDNPEADFFFSRARPEGEDPAAVAAMTRMLGRMHYAEGSVGGTGCAAVIFGEYLGSPTSGLALRAGLVKRLLPCAGKLPDYLPTTPGWGRLMGMPSGLPLQSRVYADGVLVRLASALGVKKYSIAEAGFVYRIHGQNAFAALPGRMRMYLRVQRVRQLAAITANAAGVPRRPLLGAVVEETRTRATPLRWRRRMILAGQYSLGVLWARGPILARLLALPRVALFMLRFRAMERTA